MNSNTFVIKEPDAISKIPFLKEIPADVLPYFWNVRDLKTESLHH
jgi:hypothetical protein